MAEILARYADGRLLIQESQPSAAYVTGGVPMRIGLVREVLKVLTIDTGIAKSGHVASGIVSLPGLITRLSEVTISAAQIGVVMRRGITGEETPISGYYESGVVGIRMMSGISSGLSYLAELANTRVISSIAIIANVIGW